jgi:hypothetical protein
MILLTCPLVALAPSLNVTPPSSLLLLDYCLIEGDPT